MPTFSHLSRIWLRMSCAKPPHPLPDWPFWTAAQPYSACQNKRGDRGAQRKMRRRSSPDDRRHLPKKCVISYYRLGVIAQPWRPSALNKMLKPASAIISATSPVVASTMSLSSATISSVDFSTITCSASTL